MRSHVVDRVLLMTVRLVVTVHVRPGNLCDLMCMYVISCHKGGEEGS